VHCKRREYRKRFFYFLKETDLLVKSLNNENVQLSTENQRLQNHNEQQDEKVNGLLEITYVVDREKRKCKQYFRKIWKMQQFLRINQRTNNKGGFTQNPVTAVFPYAARTPSPTTLAIQLT